MRFSTQTVLLNKILKHFSNYEITEMKLISFLFSSPVDKDQTDDSVLLTCAVLTYKGCGYTVDWLYDDDKNVAETLKSDCTAMITFSRLHQKSNNVLVRCKVTDKSGHTLLSHVSLESSGDKTGMFDFI